MSTGRPNLERIYKLRLELQKARNHPSPSEIILAIREALVQEKIQLDETVPLGLLVAEAEAARNLAVLLKRFREGVALTRAERQELEQQYRLLQSYVPKRPADRTARRVIEQLLNGEQQKLRQAYQERMAEGTQSLGTLLVIALVAIVVCGALAIMIFLVINTPTTPQPKLIPADPTFGVLAAIQAPSETQPIQPTTTRAFTLTPPKTFLPTITSTRVPPTSIRRPTPTASKTVLPKLLLQTIETMTLAENKMNFVIHFQNNLGPLTLNPLEVRYYRPDETVNLGIAPAVTFDVPPGESQIATNPIRLPRGNYVARLFGMQPDGEIGFFLTEEGRGDFSFQVK